MEPTWVGGVDLGEHWFALAAIDPSGGTEVHEAIASLEVPVGTSEGHGPYGLDGIAFGLLFGGHEVHRDMDVLAGHPDAHLAEASLFQSPMDFIGLFIAPSASVDTDTGAEVACPGILFQPTLDEAPEGFWVTTPKTSWAGSEGFGNCLASRLAPEASLFRLSFRIANESGTQGRLGHFGYLLSESNLCTIYTLMGKNWQSAAHTTPRLLSRCGSYSITGGLPVRLHFDYGFQD